MGADFVLCGDDFVPIAFGLIALVVFRVIHGVSWGVSTTAVLTTVTDLIPEKRRGEGLGWSGMAMTISMAIGPMIGVWFVEGFSFTFLFVSGTIIALVALVLASQVNVAFAKPVSSEKKLILFDKQIIPISVSTFFLCLFPTGELRRSFPYTRRASPFIQALSFSFMH